MTNHPNRSRRPNADSYDEHLAEAKAALAERLQAVIGDDHFLSEQLPKSLDDALNNEWVGGMLISQWIENAARRVGI